MQEDSALPEGTISGDEKRTRGSLSRLFFLFFSLCVSVSVLTYLLTRVSWEEVLESIRGVHFLWLLLFAFFSLSMSFFRTWRYQLVLNMSAYRAPSFPLFLITLVRNFFSDLLPARLGTLVYVYLVKSRLALPVAPVVSSFAYAFLFDIISLALLLLPVALTLTVGAASSFALLGTGLALAGAGGLVVALLPGFCDKAGQVMARLSFFPERRRLLFAETIITSGQHLREVQRQGAYLPLLALSLAVRLFKYLAMYVLFLGLLVPEGYSVASLPFPQVFVGLCSAEFAASLPVSGIAGFGLYEGAWSLVFQLLGYPEHIAVLSSVSHHLLTQIYGYSLGMLALVVLLLPVFSRSGKCENVVFTRKRFWIRYGGAILLVAFLGWLLFPADQGTLASTGMIASRQTKVRGHVVYERPDGIYVADLQGKDTKKLVHGGRYPRWSPDGRQVVFIRQNSIMMTPLVGDVRDIGNLAETDGCVEAAEDARTVEIVELAQAQQPRAVCFRGKDTVLFSDGGLLKEYNLQTGKIVQILRDDTIFELGISSDGQRLAATVKNMTGYHVRLFDLAGMGSRTLARGCSASISPDGSTVTVNGKAHRVLFLYDWQSMGEKGRVMAPMSTSSGRFDNQSWSNDRDWIVSTAEGVHHDIYMHNVTDGTLQQITFTGDCDRADLYIEK